jgi:hypothetical protein
MHRNERIEVTRHRRLDRVFMPFPARNIVHSTTAVVFCAFFGVPVDMLDAEADANNSGFTRWAVRWQLVQHSMLSFFFAYANLRIVFSIGVSISQASLGTYGGYPPAYRPLRASLHLR